MGGGELIITFRFMNECEREVCKARVTEDCVEGCSECEWWAEEREIESWQREGSVDERMADSKLEVIYLLNELKD